MFSRLWTNRKAERKARIILKKKKKHSTVSHNLKWFQLKREHFVSFRFSFPKFSFVCCFKNAHQQNYSRVVFLAIRLANLGPLKELILQGSFHHGVFCHVFQPVACLHWALNPEKYRTKLCHTVFQPIMLPNHSTFGPTWLWRVSLTDGIRGSTRLPLIIYRSTLAHCGKWRGSRLWADMIQVVPTVRSQLTGFRTARMACPGWNIVKMGKLKWVVWIFFHL